MLDAGLTPREKSLVQAARSLPPADAPRPWGPMTIIPGAGIKAAGWDAAENIVMLSRDGYTVADPRSGTQLRRDRDFDITEGLSADFLHFRLPGAETAVHVFGVWAGDGTHVTADGWRVEVIYPLWPRCQVILHRPPSPVTETQGYFGGASMLRLTRLEDFGLKCGFSPSGRGLMVLGSGGVEVTVRP